MSERILTIQASTSDLLAALSAEAKLSRARADGAQHAFDMALNAILKEQGVTTRVEVRELKGTQLVIDDVAA